MNDLNNTNKIFVQNIVITKLRFQQNIVLTIIFFDIAAIFFDNNQIAHVRFKIFLNFNNQNICNIKKNTNRATFLKTTKLIFWNETFMQQKYDILIVNCIFFNICDVKKIVFFDNKMICFCDNFKQCLSVCSCKSRNIIIIICLLHFFFWKNVIIFRLIINIKLRNSKLNKQKRRDAARFVKQMLKVNNAIIIVISNNNEHDWIL